MKKPCTSLRKISISILIIFFFVTIAASIFQDRPLGLVSASDTTIKLRQYTIYDWQHTLTPQQYANCIDAFQIGYDASSTLINQIHAIEPTFIGLVYRNVIKISKYASSEWTEFAAKNYILKDAAGNYPYETRYSYCFADIGNAGYQQWVASWIYNQTTKKNANGGFFDGGLCTTAAETWEFASSRPMNPRTGTYWTDQEVRDAYVGLHNTIRAKLGADRLIVVNGIWWGSRWLSRMDAYKNMLDRTSINGIMGEGWWRDYSPSAPWYSESVWKSSLDALVSLENNFVKGSSSKMLIPGCYVENGDASLPPGTSATQVARYGYASTLLGTQSNSDYLYLTINLTRLQDYSSRYFSLSVGAPLGNYSLVPATHVYQRSFSNALVLVNPTGTPYAVPLSGQYKDLNGATVSGSYTVPAYTGEVLMITTQNQYSLTANVVGSGSVTKNPNQASYASGAVVSLTAVPASGWSFTGWSGDLSGSANPASITMNGNKAVTATFTGWWNSSWRYRMNITIDHTKVSSNQNNFPVLVDFTNATFAGKTQANGQDFVFTDVSNNKLNHQIELYNRTAGHLVAWVRVPLLSSTTDTTLRMYYGNSACTDQQNKTGVWNNDYLMVLHLGDGPTQCIDSTANGNNGTLSGNVTQTQGKIGGSINLTGGYVALPRICTNQTQFTFSAWIYPRTGARYFISEWNSANSQGAFLQVSGDTEIQFYINAFKVAKPVSLNQWQYVVGTFDGTTARLWVNGGTSSSMSTSPPTWPSQSMFIGDRADHTRKFKGYIDEVRVSRMARSGDWIKTEYNNQNSPSTFYKAGAEETFSA